MGYAVFCIIKNSFLSLDKLWQVCYCEKTFECKNKFLKGVGHNDELYDFKKNRKNELSGCCVHILLVSSKDII